MIRRNGPGQHPAHAPRARRPRAERRRTISGAAARGHADGTGRVARLAAGLSPRARSRYSESSRFKLPYRLGATPAGRSRARSWIPPAGQEG